MIKCLMLSILLVSAIGCFPCGEAVQGSDGPEFPVFTHLHQRLSPDGRTLFYRRSGEIALLDLETLTTRNIDLDSLLPDNVQVRGIGNAMWCPYDPKRLLLFCATATDTTGGSSTFLWGENLYLLHTDSLTVTRLTPAIYGPAGSQSQMYVQVWLQGSTSGIDSISGQFQMPLSGSANKRIEGVYIPQQQTFVDKGPPALYAQSRQGSGIVGYSFNGRWTLSLNGKPLQFEEHFEHAGHVSWSPDGRFIAVSVEGTFDGAGRQVWIIDAEEAMLAASADRSVPVRVIDMFDRYCAYSRHGMYAEFITNESLAVSIHQDGDLASFLWEVDLNGRVIRRLTDGWTRF